jgi:hypothetical protein
MGYFLNRYGAARVEPLVSASRGLLVRHLGDLPGFIHFASADEIALASCCGPDDLQAALKLAAASVAVASRSLLRDNDMRFGFTAVIGPLSPSATGSDP